MEEVLSRLFCQRQRMNSMDIHFQVTSEYNGKKLYHILRGPMKLSSRLVTQLKGQQGILINGQPMRTIDPVRTGDLVSARIGFQEESFMIPEEIPLTVVYEDDCLLAVNKNPHTPVHPSMGHQSGTLAQGILWHYQKQGLMTKVRPVNRLDRDTSGITLFAKNAHIQEQLIQQMKVNRVYKAYLGIVHGLFSPDSGTIRLPIGRKEGSLLERVIDPQGDDSITHYKTLEVHTGFSLVEFVLETGRTHQIRVHAKALNHPLLGDWLYSDTPTPLIDRQALHAYQLAFDHPLSGERINLTAPLPEDMKRVLAHP